MNHKLEYINKIELHYWLKDNSHTINAFILNNSERELLGLIQEVAKIFRLDIEIEAQALGEGGIRSWFKIIAKSEDKRAIISTSILTALLTALLSTPVIKISENLIDKLFEDKELVRIEKEIKQHELEKLKLDIRRLSEEIEDSTVVKKKRSNFYKSIDEDVKIDKISFISYYGEKCANEVIVDKAEFKKYILVTDELDPEVIDDAIIEIMAPVLKKGNHKWWGYYNGEKISFTMKSNEFKTLVQIGEIEFKNGSSIDCSLTLSKVIDNEGNVKVKDHIVTRVNKYFQNNNPIETNEGRVHRKNMEADRKQLKLF